MSVTPTVSRSPSNTTSITLHDLAADEISPQKLEDAKNGQSDRIGDAVDPWLVAWDSVRPPQLTLSGAGLTELVTRSLPIPQILETFLCAVLAAVQGIISLFPCLKKRKKWLLSFLGIAFCGAVSQVVSSYSITIPSLQQELGCSREVALLGVTSFVVTFGSAPLILAPLSEVFGRHPLYVVSAVVFFLFTLAQALAKNVQTVIVARFFAGIGGSTGVAIVGGSLADLWNDGDRSLPMNLFAMIAFCTTGLGPVLFGFVEYRTYPGWRITEWVMFGMAGVLLLFVLLVSQETRASIVLHKKAKRMRKETGDERYYAASELQKLTFQSLFVVALLRPLRMLFTEPIVAAFSTWLAFCWTVLYLALISVPIILEETYGFNVEQVGLAFNASVVASFVALVITIGADRLYRRDVDRLGPDARLYPALLAGIIFPIGMWWYAWTPWPSVPWIFCLIGLIIVYCSLQLCYVSCFNTLVDTYGIYAASALSAQTFLRNMMGAASPLFTTQLYSSLGIHPASSLLAGIATLLSITPFLLFRYGKTLRQRSPFASALAAEAQQEGQTRALRSSMTMDNDEKA